MGVKNYLIEGVSGTGKTTVCAELKRRGHHAVNGDTDLAYQGDPATGEPTDGLSHKHHLWRVADVQALVANHDAQATFFCGGSRNFADFIDLMDAVFVLEIDSDTLRTRLDARGPDEWGGRPDQRELILRLHHTQEDVPSAAISIDATAPIRQVVDEILRLAGGVAGA